MIGFLRWIFFWVISGGNAWLRSYEAQAIFLLYKALNENEKKLFIKQLKLLDLVQRSPNGHISQVFQMVDSTRLNWEACIKIPCHSKPERVFRVRMYDGGCLYLRGVLYITHGAFTSLEFDTIPDYFHEKAIKITELYKNFDEIEDTFRAMRLLYDCEEINSDEAEDIEEYIMKHPDNL